MEPFERRAGNQAEPIFTQTSSGRFIFDAAPAAKEVTLLNNKATEAADDIFTKWRLFIVRNWCDEDNNLFVASVDLLLYCHCKSSPLLYQ
jgi:hypothetical protein